LPPEAELKEHIMTEKLMFYAGEKALETLREQGLTPDRVRVMAGAAGGPKWLVLYGLDRFLFSSWFTGRTTPLYLIGSSIGAFRFCTAMNRDPIAAIDRLLDAYIHQQYTEKPSPEEISVESRAIIEKALGQTGTADVLSHPFLRLNFIAARCRGLSADDRKIPQLLGLIGAVLGNLISRKTLGFFFERALFYDSRNPAPFHAMNNVPTRRIPLTRDNLCDAVLASGSIPMIMSGIRDIEGTEGGTFRDGGLLDYHLDIPYGLDQGIVLFPHYTDRIIPGWLDKSLKYRKPDKQHLKNMLMICPSKPFIESLPCAKIPDRNDFYVFKDNDNERFKTWQAVADRSRELADDFAEAVDSGSIKDRVRPFPV
jgi:hypothetical protein